MARYAYIFSDAAENRFLRAADGYHYVLEPRIDLADECIDAFVSLYVRMCRALSDDRSLSPLRIEMPRPRPHCIDEFERVLRAPLHFDAAETRLVYRHADLERRLDGGNEELATQHDAIAYRYLARVASGNIVASVEAVIVELLPGGEPRQSDVAERLHIGVRTLQRKLAEADLTYSDLVESTRQRLATAYLASPRYSASEVSYLLGFADSSSFTRAFKRWTGQPPSAFRRDAGTARPSSSMRRP